MALTKNDNTVLSQLFDPEAAPSAQLVIDGSLPADPWMNASNMQELQDKEKRIIHSVESAIKLPRNERMAILHEALSDLSMMLEEYPKSASLLNDYAQVARLVLGDRMLLLDEDHDITTKVITSLDRAVELLTPPTPQTAIAPAQARTLAQAHTQRGALLYTVSKALSADSSAKCTLPLMRLWTAVDFAEAASRDFFLGGRYGNEIAKALAVHTNPTAKLCGQMVKDAMRREFAESSTTLASS